MAVIAESATWAETVYELETTDPVEGGPEGVSNTAAQQLANRTAYLKSHSVISDPALAAYVAGDIFYATGAGRLAKVSIGATNRVMTSSGSAPQWSDSLSLGGEVRGGSLRASSGDIEAKATNGVDLFALSVVGEGFMTFGHTTVANVATQGFSGLVLVRRGATTGAGINSSALYLVSHDPDAVLLIGQNGGGASYSNAKDTSGCLNLYFEAGVLKFQNVSGGAAFMKFMVLRTE